MRFNLRSKTLNEVGISSSFAELWATSNDEVVGCLSSY